MELTANPLGPVGLPGWGRNGEECLVCGGVSGGGTSQNNTNGRSHVSQQDTELTLTSLISGFNVVADWCV